MFYSSLFVNIHIILPHYGNTKNQKSAHVFLQKGQQEWSFIDTDIIVIASHVSHKTDGILGKVIKCK